MIGERLSDVRKDYGDTQEALAEKLAVSLATVRSWEQEKSSPSHEMLVKICRMYSVTADYLLGLTDNDPLIQARTRSEFSEAEQALIKDFEDFLSWRHKK